MSDNVIYLQVQYTVYAFTRASENSDIQQVYDDITAAKRREDTNLEK